MTVRFSFVAILLVAVPAALWAGPISGYTQTSLVSDIPGLAAFTDPNLVNPWGITTSGSSPFWISDNGSGKSTLYNTAGMPQGLVVSMPVSGATPTGVVFSGTTNFNGDLFIFATEDGTINGWRGALGTNAEVLSADNSNSVYKGLATGLNGGNQYLTLPISATTKSRSSQARARRRLRATLPIPMRSPVMRPLTFRISATSCM
jgi:hypothetical protein